MKGKVDAVQLGKAGVLLFGGADFVRAWWWAWLLIIIVSTVALIWSLKHYVGKGRRWLDNHVLPFQMARDFNAAAFFSTVSSITTPRNGNVVQIRDALQQLKQNAYPWLRWQINMVLENLAARPNSKGEMFNTGITDKKTYYRILDIGDYAEVPVMLQKTGEIILRVAPADIQRRANVLKVVLVAVCMVSMLSIYGGTFALINAFKTAAMMKSLH
jgi:type II secretory pathway component PulF